MNTPPKLTPEDCSQLRHRHHIAISDEDFHAIEAAVNRRWINTLAATPGVAKIMDMLDNFEYAVLGVLQGRRSSDESAQMKSDIRAAVEQALAARTFVPEAALEKLRGVLCDPEGRCCIDGSDADRKEVDDALAMLEPQEGYMWAPVEPLPEMLEAAVGGAKPHPTRPDKWAAYFRKKYQDMLAKSPNGSRSTQPPVAPAGAVAVVESRYPLNSGGFRIHARADRPIPVGAALYLAAQLPQWTPSEADVDYVARYGGVCRDCADENGACPRSGLPCADSRKAIAHVLDALAYGWRHGYLKTVPTSPLQPPADPEAPAERRGG